MATDAQGNWHPRRAGLWDTGRPTDLPVSSWDLPFTWACTFGTC